MADPMPPTEAIANAVRLLQAAEIETNLAIAEAVTRLAECWLQAATVLRDCE